MTERRVPARVAGALADTTDRAIDRRQFLQRGIAAAGAVATAAAATAARAADPIGGDYPEWSTKMGAPLRGYGQPSRFEAPIQRYVQKAFGDLAPGTGGARAPIERLEGVITPNGLHFDRSHNGAPDIDPAKHQLLIHGLVKRALSFSIADLLRYPMVSRMHFIECSGNSGGNLAPQPAQVPAGVLHGLVSCADWTGIPLGLLLDEAGVDPAGKWLLAEGADSAAMSRSIPLEKAYDDAIVALYQNGERLRPEQGYPVRLLLPGWEGNMNVKWLHRLKVTSGPTHTRDETSRYTDPQPDGKARQFTFELGVKSLILRPSSTMSMQGAGLYEIAGLAWSGAGRIARVEVSTDSGATWKEAALQGPSLPKSLLRFRAPWEWNGQSTNILSRATDEKGNTQPTRTAFKAEFAPDIRFHNNTIVSWAVNADGSVKNVYV